MSTEHPSLQNPGVAGPSRSADSLVDLARAALARTGDGEPIAWDDLDVDDPATRRFGDYELLEVLGAGGMGVVYRARQLSLDREVAIKFIAAGAADEFSIERFLAEARSAARLNHPNIVPVHEVGSRGGLHYFSMQLVTGTHLGKRLAQGPLAEREAIDLLLPLCDALDYAHRLGVLHLDLKPANILIDGRGAPLIADFGLARRMDASGSVQPQEVSGTPAYMAPEQVLIKQYRLTTATDLYSLGAVLFEMLAGVSPHGHGAGDEVIRRAVSGRLESLVAHRPGINRDLAAVCMHCLDLDPNRRYAGVAALADDLRRVRDGLPVSVRAPGRIERVRRWLAREPRFAAASAFAVAALALGIGASAWLWQRAESERRIAETQREEAVAAQAREAAQRQRAELATALGVRLYVRADDPAVKFDAAEETVAWLREQLPDSPRMQAEILGDFARLLTADDSQLRVQMLLYTVIEKLGGEYRKQLVQALSQRDDAQSLLYAAMLAWRDEEAATKPEIYPPLLERALAADPDSAFAWFVAATYCHRGALDRPKCVRDDAGKQLVRVDGANGFAWTMLAAGAEDDRFAAALHEAARRERFRDYFGTAYFGYQQVIERSGVAIPPLLEGPARVLAPNEPAADTVAQLEAWALPAPMWNGLIVRCDPARSTIMTPALRADCLAVGIALARNPGGLISNMIGAVIVRRLAKGTELEAEMKALRLRYTYIAEQAYKLKPAQRLSFTSRRFQEDQLRLGELEALAAMLRAAGVPDQPPAGWQPKDPETLLLPEERSKR